MEMWAKTLINYGALGIVLIYFLQKDKVRTSEDRKDREAYRQFLGKTATKIVEQELLIKDHEKRIDKLENN